MRQPLRYGLTSCDCSDSGGEVIVAPDFESFAISDGPDLDLLPPGAVLATIPGTGSGGIDEINKNETPEASITLYNQDVEATHPFDVDP